jgi:hypothetical protein
MLVRPERDEGEQAEQGGGGAGDSLIGPLALGLDAVRMRALDTVMERIEPRRRALAYLRRPLSPVERKNGWQLAGVAGDRMDQLVPVCGSGTRQMSPACTRGTP